MKKKIVYIISNTEKALAFEWFIELIDKEKIDPVYILLNPEKPYFSEFLEERKIRVYNIKYHGKNNIFSAFFSIFRILIKERPAVVHCHLFDATLIGLCAAKLCFIKERIYTRHHSDYHFTYFPSTVKYDKVNNRLATKIIAISQNVKRVLVEKEKVPERKIYIIPHGLNFKIAENVTDSKVAELKSKYNPTGKTPVVGVISRYTELKGIQYIIPAFLELLKSYPDALLVLANATGTFKEEIKKLLQQVPQKNYVEIVFEPELFALYRLFDVFVHVPVSLTCEAFGQTYIESLAAGVPSIFTLSGIAPELVRHEQNAIIVSYRNSDDIYRAFLKLLSDKDFAKSLSENGKKDAKKFDIRETVRLHEELYLSK